MSWPFEVSVPCSAINQAKSNYISTTKYSVLTFLPVALLSQFRRYANIYFLACAILQSISIISPLQPFSAVAPLIFVLSLSLIREGFQDYKRWRSDQTDNSQLTLRIKQGGVGVESIKWKDLKQGDCIKILKDQIIPADCLAIVASSASGICYVETASLDGEKNLKPRFSNALFQRHYNEYQTLKDLPFITGRILCSNPSAQLDAFQGRAQLSAGSVNIEEAVNRKNMLLRGCKLRNTDWAVGVIVYTGEQTGIMMNGSQPFTKTSNLQQRVNSLILTLLAFQIIASLASAVYCYFSCHNSTAFESFLTRKTPNCLSTSAISLGSYFILYSSFIPISLIVSLQFVKVFQGGVMSGDREMYCGLNRRSLECRTVSINEELGQVDYILTDKTGTLTCNRMEFRNIVIGNQIYGENLTFKALQHIDYERLSARYTVDHRQEHHFDPRRLSYDLFGGDHAELSKRKMIQLIFLAICTCHECVPTSGGGFEGPSPDEVALLKAAEKVGFKFISCQNKIIRVEYAGKVKSFELLKLIEFDSDRKRMTVVLRNEGEIIVFVKGADTSIGRILAPGQKYLDEIRSKTEEMSRTGLRSLWFAYKILHPNTNVSALSEEDIESQLSLLGASGIEDKLQDFVAQTIYSLRSGGIKFIMLTGDKLQTAQNIALSCRLIEEGYLIRNGKDLQQFVSYIDHLENSLQSVAKSPVIDGSSVNFIENEINLELAIAKTKSVVFCRVTPGQKAEIVRLVKRMGKLTLAIGDGANDVNMIMQANVGVGIFGEEGTRAAQVANYAIGQFCLLWKLLLFYGRLNYIKISDMVLYFFYKNTVFTVIQLAYCFYSMGSGQSFWLSWSITFFNMVFTFFPVVLRAVFEVDLELQPSKATFHQLSQGKHDKQILYSYYPKMYYISQKNQVFTKTNFFAWQLLGIFQGAICLLVTLYAIGNVNDVSGSNSYVIGFYLIQISAYTSVIIVVTIKLAVNVKHWTLVLGLGFLVPSIGAYVLFTFIAQFFQTSISYNDMIDLLSMPSFYCVQFMCIGSMLCFDFLLFSIESSKNNFQNYLKNKTLKSQRLSESNLNKYILEMTEMNDRGE